jgi:hypothetical protein
MSNKRYIANTLRLIDFHIAASNSIAGMHLCPDLGL